MTYPAIKQTEQEPDWYANQSYMINEIVLAHQILKRKIDKLRTENQARSAVSQKLAAEEVSRLAEQLKVCADIVVRTSSEFLKRRPR
jgi:hypothetical protein